MMKKLFITDVDGTLLSGSSGVSMSTILLANEFVKRGNLLSLCTGRSIPGTRELFRTLPINAPVVLSTGAIIYDGSSMEILEHYPLNESCIHILLDVFEAFPDVAVQLFSMDRVYTCRTNGTLRNKGVLSERSDQIVRIENIVDRPILKALLVHGDREMLEECRLYLLARDEQLGKSSACTCEYASRHFMEVFSTHAGKGKGLQRILSLLEIERENVFVAGDGLTDLDMFKEAGCSFAPEDAICAVIRNATHIIPSAKRYGIDVALQFILDL